LGKEKIVKIEEFRFKFKKRIKLLDIQVEGDDTFVLNGIVIHNSVVHNGIPEDIPITGTQTIHVPGYRRKDGAYVRPHDVTYKNKRVVQIRTSTGERVFRVIDRIKARAPRPFLLEAMQEGIKFIDQDVGFCMARKGYRVK